MAILKMRRAWARGALAVVNVLVAISAALFVKPSAPVAPPLAQVGTPLPPGAAACHVIYNDIAVPFNAGARARSGLAGFIEASDRPLWPGSRNTAIPAMFGAAIALGSSTIGTCVKAPAATSMVATHLKGAGRRGGDGPR